MRLFAGVDGKSKAVDETIAPLIVVLVRAAALEQPAEHGDQAERHEKRLDVLPEPCRNISNERIHTERRRLLPLTAHSHTIHSSESVECSTRLENGHMSFLGIHFHELWRRLISAQVHTSRTYNISICTRTLPISCK